MVLRIDSPYVVIPVQDPYWRERCCLLATHLELALHHCWRQACSEYAGMFPGDLPEATGQPISLASGLLSDDTVSGCNLGVDICQGHVTEECEPKGEQPVLSSHCAGASLLQTSFDDELLEHSMQVFAALSQFKVVDLQVDWSLPGPGFVTTNALTMSKPKLQEQPAPDNYTVGQCVLLSGLSMKGLNGEVGVVTNRCSASKRYGVKLASGRYVAVRACNMALLAGSCAADPSASFASRPKGTTDLPKSHEGSYTANERSYPGNPGELQLGQSVRLTGLSDANLNGQVGRVATTLTPAERYGVKMPCGGHIAVRPRNLKLVVNEIDGEDISVEKTLFRFPPGTAKPFTY